MSGRKLNVRSVFVLCAFLLTACSTHAVRCERHLTPINVPKRPIGLAVAPSDGKDASARIGAVKSSQGAQRAKANDASGHAKQPAPASGGEGMP